MSIFAPSQPILTPSDLARGAHVDPFTGEPRSRCRRCGKRQALGVAGTMLGCCCRACACNGTACSACGDTKASRWRIVENEAVTGCTGCYQCTSINGFATSQNRAPCSPHFGGFVINNDNGCCLSAIVNNVCIATSPLCSDVFPCGGQISTNLSRCASIGFVQDGADLVAELVLFGQEGPCGLGGVNCLAAWFVGRKVVSSCCQATIVFDANLFDACGDSPIALIAKHHGVAGTCATRCAWPRGIGGSFTLIRCGDALCPDIECVHCSGCNTEKKISCGSDYWCCTPSTIRLTTSSIAVDFDSCISTTSELYKLTGSTAASRTIDLAQHASDKCKWENTVSSNWTLARAGKTNLDTLVYEWERTASNQWTARIYARDAGDMTRVYFMPDSTVTAVACETAATANNASTSCSLTANPKRGGHSGTFAKPLTSMVGVSCGNCSLSLQPPSFTATISGVAACVNQCDGNLWQLRGSTSIDRSITVSQVAGQPCLYRGTVAADYVLFDLDTPAESWSNLTLRYRLRRTAATTNGWEYDVNGEDAAGVVRVSVVGSNPGSCGFGAIKLNAAENNCADIGTVTHTTRTTCVSAAGPTGIFGSGGSTSFAACQDGGALAMAAVSEEDI